MLLTRQQMRIVRKGIVKKMKPFKIYKYAFFCYYTCRRLIQKVRNVIFRKQKYSCRGFKGRKWPDNETSNALIGSYIKKGTPFCLIRPGNGEFSLVAQYDEWELFKSKRVFGQKMARILNSDKNHVKKYVHMFQRDLGEVNIIAHFDGAYMEQYLVRCYGKNEYNILMGGLNPLIAKKPWTNELLNKRVLFISPFAETMKHQYKVKDKLFDRQWAWPEMDAQFLQSVWYLSKEDNGGFSSWFDALNYLYEEAMKIDFDIVIMGCGPFAINLAPMFKRAGKQAIQYGGELQLMFGIMGLRWENNEFFQKYYNQYWVRPLKENAPLTQKGVVDMDEGCYW